MLGSTVKGTCGLSLHSWYLDCWAFFFRGVTISQWPDESAGCDGFSVFGSANQPSINGCFVDRNALVAGFPSYENENKRILYWEAVNGGNWVIGDSVGANYRAFGNAPGGDGPAAVSSWKTSEDGWVAEALTVTDSRCTQARGDVYGLSFSVTGSALQPSINGFFVDSLTCNNGFPVYSNGNGKSLWWYLHNSKHPTWMLGLDSYVEKDVGLAYGNGQGGDGPAAASGWVTWNGAEWKPETTWAVADSRGLCSTPSPPPPQVFFSEPGLDFNGSAAGCSHLERLKTDWPTA